MATGAKHRFNGKWWGLVYVLAGLVILFFAKASFVEMASFAAFSYLLFFYGNLAPDNEAGFASLPNEITFLFMATFGVILSGLYVVKNVENLTAYSNQFGILSLIGIISVYLNYYLVIRYRKLKEQYEPPIKIENNLFYQKRNRKIKTVLFTFIMLGLLFLGVIAWNKYFELPLVIAKYLQEILIGIPVIFVVIVLLALRSLLKIRKQKKCYRQKSTKLIFRRKRIRLHVTTAVLFIGGAFIESYLMREYGYSIIDLPDYISMLLVPLYIVTIFFFIDGPMRKLFSLVTHHREAWHSSTAAIIAGFITFDILEPINTTFALVSFLWLLLVSNASSFGYYCHLLTDVANSVNKNKKTVTHDGEEYDPKNGKGYKHQNDPDEDDDDDEEQQFNYSNALGTELDFLYPNSWVKLFWFLVLYSYIASFIVRQWEYVLLVYNNSIYRTVYIVIFSLMIILYLRTLVMHKLDMKTEQKLRERKKE